MNLGRWQLGVEGCRSVGDKERSGEENQDKQILLENATLEPNTLYVN